MASKLVQLAAIAGNAIVSKVTYACRMLRRLRTSGRVAKRTMRLCGAVTSATIENAMGTPPEVKAPTSHTAVSQERAWGAKGKTATRLVCPRQV